MVATRPLDTAASPATTWLSILDSRATELGIETEAAKATALGVNPSTFWRWRVGRRKPSAVKALEIARLLDIPVEQVIEP